MRDGRAPGTPLAFVGVVDLPLIRSIDLDRADDARPLREVFVAPLAAGTRRRRGGDGVRLVLGLAVLVAVAVVAHVLVPGEAGITNGLVRAKPTIGWPLSALFVASTVGVGAIVLVVGILVKPTLLLRDAALALGIAVVLAAGYATVAPRVRVADGFALQVPTGSVVAIVVTTVALLLAIAPYLARGLRRSVLATTAVTSVAAVLDVRGIPTAVLASVVLGWMAVAACHLLVGSPEGLPSIEEIGSLVRELGVDVDGLRHVEPQRWGALRAVGTVDDSPVEVVVVGRDATEAQYLAKLGRALLYRDSGPALATSGLQQVEHEALACLLAAGVLGDRAPSVVAVGEVLGSAVLVLRRPTGTAWPADAASAALALDRLFGQLATLGNVVVHGAIGPEAVLVDGANVGFTGFERAAVATSHEGLARDLAATLVVAASSVGADAAVASARASLGDDRLAAALPLLQRAALPSALTPILQANSQIVADIRQRGADVLGIEAPDLVEPRRMAPASLVLAVGTVVGGWALLAVFAHVASSLATLRTAGIEWVVGTFVLAQLATASVALTTVGAVLSPLGFGAAFALEVSNAFSSLAAGTVGTLGARVRFFQRRGSTATAAITSAAVSSVASWIAKAAVAAVALPVALHRFHLHGVLHPTGTAATLVSSALLVVAALGLTTGAVVAVPALRRFLASKIRPKVDETLGHLRALASRPTKLAMVLGGAVLAQVLVGLALETSLLAFGVHLPLAACLVALSLGSILGGLSPVPGGMGVVEAGMILALTGTGIPDEVAVSAVFVQRLCTAYLPPLWGWVTLVQMRRRDLL